MNKNPKYKKVVIKVGSNVLSTNNGHLDTYIIQNLSRQITQIKNRGSDVILISSGAVASGKSLLKVHEKTDPISSRQVYASVGQAMLMHLYYQYFNLETLICSQVLVTKEDFRDRTHYLNMRNCFNGLLQNNIIPIVNENDVISITELMFTDNDELAALVATMIQADLLIILTNVEGLFDGDPKNPDSKVLHQISSPHDFSKYISPSKSDFGRGGMITKTNMAQKVARNGIMVKIGNGKKDDILMQLYNDQNYSIGSTFIPSKPTSNTKKEIAFSETFAKGEVYINKGAEDALFSQKASSLLMVGILKLEGEFHKGDVIRILNDKDVIIGLGKVQMSDKAAKELIGKKNQKPFIHYDYLYLYS